MEVTKLRIADENGLVPAGAYFEKLALGLRATNAKLADELDREEARERKLEERYRRASAARSSAAPTPRRAFQHAALM